MRASGVFPILLLCLVSSSPPGHSASRDDKKYIDDVRAKLAREAKQLSSEQFREVAKLEPVRVKRTGTKTFPLQLETASTYAIIASCDQDCAHLVLTLHDPSGAQLIQSPDRHHTAIVKGPAERRGRHTATVGVPGCREDECFAGLLVLVQGAQNAPAVAGAVYTESLPNFAAYDNFDVHGKDLKQLAKIDLTDCAAACADEKRCIGYSFDKWNRYCFLKATATTMRLEPNTISGLTPTVIAPARASTPVSMQRYRNKAFPYSGQSTTRAASFEECEKRCADDAPCVAFTFFKTSNQCRLMDSTGEYFSDARADSGVKRQEPTN